MNKFDILYNQYKIDDEVCPEDAIGAIIAVLKAIPDQVKERIITELRSTYPNIPGDAFEQSETDPGGPNYWECLLIARAKRLRIMPREDYKDMQLTLPFKHVLDLYRSVSWLEATDEQLKTNVAPAGMHDGFLALGSSYAHTRFDNRGVRFRAEGSLV